MSTCVLHERVRAFRPTVVCVVHPPFMPEQRAMKAAPMKTVKAALKKAKKKPAAKSSSWHTTEWQHVTQRNSKFRVILPGGAWHGPFDTMASAIQCVRDNGIEPERKKSNRESATTFLDRFALYLKLLPKQGWLPGDLVAATEIRREHPWLLRMAPAVYAVGLEGKERPFWDALLQSYSQLSSEKKRSLAMITSQIDSEQNAATKIFYAMYQDALACMATPEYRKRRKWWAGEVQYNVGEHMGWLNKATQSGTIEKSTRGPLTLGEMGNKYKLLPWTEAKNAKIAAKSRAVQTISCMPFPTRFADYERCSQIMERSNYHDLFLNRAVCEGEREQAGQTNELSLAEDVDVERFVKVFPDSCGWVQKLGRHYGTNSVKRIMQKCGYAELGLPVSHFTAHLCFNGQLHNLDIEGLGKVKKRHMQQARAAHKQDHYEGHPYKILRDAIRLCTE